MGILSSPVSAGDTILASGYNNLRTDLLTGDIAIAGVKTFSSVPVFSAGITISDDSSIAATKKLYLDGSGDTYIVESSANVIDFYTGGTKALEIDSGQQVIISTSNLVLTPTKKLYLDGSADTYIVESSANVIDFYAGGFIMLQLDGNSSPKQISLYHDTALAATKKLYLDGSGDTYIVESSANVVDFYTNNVNAITIDANQQVSINANNLVLSATKKLYLSADGDTSISETQSNVIGFETNGTQRFEISSVNFLGITDGTHDIGSTSRYMDGIWYNTLHQDVCYREKKKDIIFDKPLDLYYELPKMGRFKRINIENNIEQKGFIIDEETNKAKNFKYIENREGKESININSLIGLLCECLRDLDNRLKIFEGG